MVGGRATKKKKKKKEKVVQTASSCIIIPEKARRERERERKKTRRKERGRKKIFCRLRVFFGNLFLLVVYRSSFCINTLVTLFPSLVYSVLA